MSLRIQTQDLTDLYTENEGKKMLDWLKISSLFKRTGKQGIVGLAEGKKGEKFVFKISQYINYLIWHEYSVGKGLYDVCSYCPNFCKIIGVTMEEIDPKNLSDPFNPNCKRKIETDILLCEFVKGYKLYNYIINKKIPESVLYSAVKQTLLACSIASRKADFTHYDLHSNNIMLRKCDKDVVFLYKNENNLLCVPSHGYCSVIIDYGFAYSSGLEDQPLWPSLNHTEVGFLSYRKDHFADIKLFCVTVSDEINQYRKTKNSKKFKNITKNNFSTLKIDWDSGWDKFTTKSVSDTVLKLMRKLAKGKSKVFKEFDYYCIDLIQTLTILPLQNVKEKEENFLTSFSSFLTEFCKIEGEIGDSFYVLYILKGIIDIVREIRPDYCLAIKTKNEEACKKTVSFFRTAILERVDSIANYCFLKDVNFEKLLCSCICMGKGIEAILFKACKEVDEIKEKMYLDIPIQSSEEFCAALEINIPETYVFNPKTKVFLIDADSEKIEKFLLKEEDIIKLNNMENIFRGEFLYNILINQ